MATRRNDDGSILLLTVFSMIALCGIAALTLDASYAYDLRNRLAATADAAAKSSAIELWRGNDLNYAAFATHEIDAAITDGSLPTVVARSIHLCSDVAATCEPAFRTPKYGELYT